MERAELRICFSQTYDPECYLVVDMINGELSKSLPTQGRRSSDSSGTNFPSVEELDKLLVSWGEKRAAKIGVSDLESAIDAFLAAYINTIRGPRVSNPVQTPQ